MFRLTTLFLLLCTLDVSAYAASGIKGRTAWRTEVCAGVRVRAYLSINDLAADKAVAISAPTRTDGTYQLDLPAGSYYLTARDYDAKPQPGKLFCYYNGAPVTVRDNGYANVSFNMIRIPQEAPPEAGQSSGIRGEITFQGKALSRVYLYAYKDGNDGFKGPGYAIQPVEKGTFRLRLPPGDYYLIARKRAKGGQFGPIETGDHFNYYYGNPVRIEAGKTREVKLETITRLSLNEAGEELPFRGIRGVIRGTDRKPVEGLHVFAYRNPEMTGTPAFFSPPSTADGHFELALSGTGPFFLLARAAFGGPAEDGELYGKYKGTKDHALTLPREAAVREIEIQVEQVRRP